MKKSIVLLISLFFISALSVLILKNLEDTNTYLEEKNHKMTKIQALTSIQNIQVEISKIFKNNKDDVNNIVDELSNNYIPINIKDVSVFFMIKHYEKIDINLLSKKDSKKYDEVLSLFNDNDISGFDRFRYIYKTKIAEYKSNNSESYNIINNSKQVNNIIDEFIKETYDEKILEIKNEIGFLSKKESDEYYELFIKIDYLNTFSKAYYVLNKEGVVKYFESSFK